MINKSTMALKEELRTLREDLYAQGYELSDDFQGNPQHVELERRVRNNQLHREQWLMLELIMRKLKINL